MGVPGAIGDVQPFAELASRPDTVVYKAYQRSLDRVVLLKVLRRTTDIDEGLLRRFADGARLVARVQHPNVVAVHDYGEVDGQAYVVSEFVEGTDLGEILERGRMPVDLAMFVLHEVARGLEAAHRKGVLHRDIKPSNILISDEGQVKLADFGLASRLEDASDREVRGTLAYLSPEQIRGDVLDGRSDLFSLGATFFEMLSGRPAFAGQGAGALMDAVLHADPARQLDRDPAIAAPIADLTRQLLARDPSERPTSAGDLADTLRSVAGSGAFTGAGERLRTYVRKEAGATSTIALPGMAVSPGPDEGAPVVTVVPDARPAAPAARAERHSPLRRAIGIAAVVLVGVAAYAMATVTGRRNLPKQADETVQTVAPAQETTRPSNPPESQKAASEGPVGRENEAIAASDANANRIAPLEGASSPASGDPGKSVADEPASEVQEQAVVSEGIAEGPATLRIQASPWADIYVDDRLLARGQVHEATLAPGTHEVRLEHSDYPPQVRTVALAAGSRDTLLISFRETVGTLTVRAFPWAEVTIDGKSSGVVPGRDPYLLPPGAYRITLRNPPLGASLDTVVTVVAGRNSTLQVWLDDEP